MDGTCRLIHSSDFSVVNYHTSILTLTLNLTLTQNLTPNHYDKGNWDELTDGQGWTRVTMGSNVEV